QARGERRRPYADASCEPGGDRAAGEAVAAAAGMVAAGWLGPGGDIPAGAAPVRALAGGGWARRRVDVARGRGLPGLVCAHRGGWVCLALADTLSDDAQAAAFPVAGAGGVHAADGAGACGRVGGCEGDGS